MAWVVSAALMHVLGATAKTSLSSLYQVHAAQVYLAYMQGMNRLELITSSKAPAVRMHTWVGVTLPVVIVSTSLCHLLSL